MFAELICADGLRQQQAQQQADGNHRQADAQISPRHGRKAAHRPAGEVRNIAFFGEGDEEIRRRRTDVANHHADDQQHRHAVNLSGDDHHKARAEHCPDKCRGHHRAERHATPELHAEDHHRTNSQLCAGGHAQHIRPGNRIAEKRLQQKARHAQRAAHHRRRQHAWQADFEQHVVGRCARALSQQQNPQDFMRGQCRAARAHTDRQQQRKADCEHRIAQRAPRFFHPFLTPAS